CRRGVWATWASVSPGRTVPAVRADGRGGTENGERARRHRRGGSSDENRSVDDAARLVDQLAVGVEHHGRRPAEVDGRVATEGVGRIGNTGKQEEARLVFEH